MGRLLAGLVPELSLLVSERNGMDGEQAKSRNTCVYPLFTVFTAHVTLQIQFLPLNVPPETDTFWEQASA